MIENIDLYLDRNKKDDIIKSTFESLKINFKYIQENYGTLLNTNNKIALLWGLESNFKKNTFFRTTIQNNYDNVLIIEQGFLNRKDYRSLTWNEQGGKANIIPKDCDSKRFDKLNIKLKPIKLNKKGYILVCGQLPWDRQCQFINYNYDKWLNEIFLKIKKKTNKKIIFRYHPLYMNSKKKNNKKHKISIPDFVEIDKSVSLEHSISNAYVVISYNSTCLIESLIYGCPFICFDNLSLVYNLGKHSINDIDNLYIPKEEERLQKLYDISYNQWSLKELESGKGLKYMKNLLEINL